MPERERRNNFREPGTVPGLRKKLMWRKVMNRQKRLNMARNLALRRRRENGCPSDSQAEGLEVGAFGGFGPRA